MEVGVEEEDKEEAETVEVVTKAVIKVGSKEAGNEAGMVEGVEVATVGCVSSIWCIVLSLY